MRHKTCLGLAPLALGAALIGGGPAQEAYTRIGADSEPLRSAFNADRGKVRVVMLVAPT